MLTQKLQRYGPFGTHDAIKLIALLFMAIDHTGIFLFPHDLGWRIVGRAAAPIFFFLIGYSRSYRFHWDIVCAALLLVAIKFLGMHSLYYSTILVGLIIARFLLEQVERKRLSLKYPWLAFAVLVLLVPVTWPLFEYGSVGLMFSLCGYLQKNAARYGAGNRLSLLAASMALYEFMACVMPVSHPTATQLLELTVVLTTCGALLWFYRPQSLALPKPCRRFESVLTWPARYSLWVYTLPLALLHVVRGVYF